MGQLKILIEVSDGNTLQKPGASCYDLPMDTKDILFRPGRVDDADSIMEMNEEQLGRALNRERIARLLGDFPSVVGIIENRMVGFAYSEHFAPDIITLANILVDRRIRSQGVGSALLAEFEERAARDYSGIILANSSLYRSHHGDKRSARGFYLRAEYLSIFETHGTEVFAKQL